MGRSSGPVRPKPSEDIAGSRIRERRKQVGLSQQLLADSAEVSRQTIVSMEQGNYGPSVYLALRVASALDSSVEDLWG